MSPFQTPASASGTVGVPPGQQPNPAAPDARPWRRPRRADLLALAVWAGSRVVLLLISLGALASQHGTSWLGLWQLWDWDRYLTIAQYGYTSGKGPAYDSDIVAFFPGYPLLLRAVHFVVRNWVVSGLLISLVAGAVACIALSRLAAFEWRARLPHDDDHGASDGSGRAAVTAVLLLVCAPAAIFLAAGYTESLFLALAIPAWLAARRRHWIPAATRGTMPSGPARRSAAGSDGAVACDLAAPLRAANEVGRPAAPGGIPGSVRGRAGPAARRRRTASTPFPVASPAVA
jgi:Mannosyltransferase (PIG-V)